MSTRVPRIPLVLALAGTLPFIGGAALSLLPGLEPRLLSAPPQTPGLTARLVLLVYGTVILSFMAGVLWGFACRADDASSTLLFGLSVLPAIAIFFASLQGVMVVAGSETLPSLLPLIVGFPALLLFDAHFSARGLSPPWWMPMRRLITAIVTVCLLIGWAAT